MTDELSPERPLARTGLFVNGITPERVSHVVRIMPALLARVGVLPEPADIAVGVQAHNPGTHVGWIVEQTLQQKPALRARSLVAGRVINAHSLYIPRDGNLTVCSFRGWDNTFSDTILDSDRMGLYDEIAASRVPYDPGTPGFVRRFNSAAVGGLITDFAETYNLTEAVRPYAMFDAPRPE